MANEKTPVVWDDTAKKHRPLGSGEKMGGLSASSMISTDSGNLLQQGSDGLMLVTGGSIADPRADNLLEESANGKLQVTSDRVVEWLEGHPQAAAAIADAVKVVSEDSGNVIVQGADKGAFMSKNTLAGAVSTMSAAQLTTLANALRKQGGGLSVGSDGKLSVDFGSMDPSIMRNVVLSMVQQGGGIAVDQSGKLYVDFDSMPTDKFEALLKSLKMQIPLDANLSLHVDTASAAAGDTIIDGRGTAAKPFKTLQACITWAVGNYSLGRYSINIYVHPGTYDETVTCPSYNSGSGSFSILASDYANPPVFRRADSTTRTSVNVTGGSWILTRLKFLNRPLDSGGTSNFYGYGINVSEGAMASVYGCEFDMAYAGGQTDRVRLFLCYADGTLRFNSMDAYPTKLSYRVGQAAYLHVLSAGNGGKIQFTGTFSDTAVVAIECDGDATCFARANNQGLIATVGGGTRRVYCVAASGATCTGKRYEATENSGIQAPGGYAFPGDADGTVEAATYSWYKG